MQSWAELQWGMGVVLGEGACACIVTPSPCTVHFSLLSISPRLPFWPELGSTTVCFLTFLNFTCKQASRT